MDLAKRRGGMERPVNWYPHHIGDFARRTRGLSMIEDCAYRRLLEEYYLTEGPLANEERYDLAGARSVDERDAVDYVLQRFFTLTPEGTWRQEHAEGVIADYQRGKKQASEGGKKSGQKRRGQQGEEASTPVEPPLNPPSTPLEPPLKGGRTKPKTNNQEPITTGGLQSCRNTEGVQGEPDAPAAAAESPPPRREMPGWAGAEDSLLHLLTWWAVHLVDRTGAYVFDLDTITEPSMLDWAAKLGEHLPDMLTMEAELMGLNTFARNHVRPWPHPATCFNRTLASKIPDWQRQRTVAKAEMSAEDLAARLRKGGAATVGGPRG